MVPTRRAPSSADGETGNGHAFDQQEGVALHQHAVGKAAGIALVGVAYHVFLLGLSLPHGAPLDTGRKGRPATATQAGFQHLGHDFIVT